MTEESYPSAGSFSDDLVKFFENNPYYRTRDLLTYAGQNEEGIRYRLIKTMIGGIVHHRLYVNGEERFTFKVTDKKEIQLDDNPQKYYEFRVEILYPGSDQYVTKSISSSTKYPKAIFISEFASI